MVPDIAGIGKSFKGALSYYLHDKRVDERSAHPETSERVAWTATRGMLDGLSMKSAERVMIATAKRSDELKREAGVKNTGRKSNAHVYAYSLSWHPSERPTREDMERAADESLKAIGAEGRQAIIVAHTDRAHPHVHVVVNRVDPNDGRMLGLSNDRLKLDEWANRYERGRNNIVTPKREERRQKRERYADRNERREYAEKARVAAKECAHDRGSQVATLKELSAAQRAQHKAQWAELGRANKAARDRIYSQAGGRLKDAFARHKVECKPIWARHFRGERQEDRNFAYRETSAPGRLINAWQAARHQKESGQLREDAGMVGATMRNFFSAEARWRAYLEARDLSRAELSARLKGIIDGEARDIRADRGRSLDQQRELHGTERAALTERQRGERGKLSEAWAAIRPARQPSGRKPHWKSPDQERTDEAARSAGLRERWQSERDRPGRAVSDDRNAGQEHGARPSDLDRRRRERQEWEERDHASIGDISGIVPARRKEAEHDAEGSRPAAVDEAARGGSIRERWAAANPLPEVKTPDWRETYTADRSPASDPVDTHAAYKADRARSDQAPIEPNVERASSEDIQARWKAERERLEREKAERERQANAKPGPSWTRP